MTCQAASPEQMWAEHVRTRRPCLLAPGSDLQCLSKLVTEETMTKHAVRTTAAVLASDCSKCESTRGKWLGSICRLCSGSLCRPNLMRKHAHTGTL